MEKENVNMAWRQLTKAIIGAKCGQYGPMAFLSKQKLREGAETYCKSEAASMEKIACTTGYPLDKWDVSRVENHV
jgi:hypothetical protein